VALVLSVLFFGAMGSGGLAGPEAGAEDALEERRLKQRLKTLAVYPFEAETYSLSVEELHLVALLTLTLRLVSSTVREPKLGGKEGV